MDLFLHIADSDDDGVAHRFLVELLTPSRVVLDADYFRFAKQTKRVLLNPLPDGTLPPTPIYEEREGNTFDYGLLAEIASRHFLRLQGQIPRATGRSAWQPRSWRQIAGIALPPALPLAQRRALMRETRLTINAPDIRGALRGLSRQPGTVTTIITDFDGDVRNNGVTADGVLVVRAGWDGGGWSYRGYVRFPLGAIGASDTVSDVDLKVNIFWAGGATGLWDYQAYNQDGQADPNTDAGADRYARCGDDATPYIDDTIEPRTTGIKTYNLPAAANTDVEAAKTAVNRFSIGTKEQGDDDDSGNFESIENAGTDEARLIVTHTAASVAAASGAIGGALII